MHQQSAWLLRCVVAWLWLWLGLCAHVCSCVFGALVLVGVQPSRFACPGLRAR